jgi:hypothetical protein
MLPAENFIPVHLLISQRPVKHMLDFCSTTTCMNHASGYGTFYHQNKEGKK